MSNEQSTTEEVIATTAAALSRDEPLSSKECVDLLMKVGQRKVEVDVRVEAITPERNGRFAGKVRTRTLQTGTAKQIADLDAECVQLEILQAQLGAQHKALHERRQRAGDEEASAGLPSLQAEFLGKLAAAEAARDALNAALTALDGGFDAIAIARARAKVAHLPAPGAAPETAERVEALSGSLGLLDQHRSVMGRIMGRDLRERLGVEVGDPSARWAA